MKKSIFLSALAVLAAAAVSVSVYMKNETNPMDELFEANVEALASGESGLFGPMCSQTAKSGTYRMKLCSNCGGSFGNYAMDYVSFCVN